MRVLPRVGRAIVVWIGLLALWESLVRLGILSGLFMPPPTRIGAACWNLFESGSLPSHLLATLGRIAIGLACGAGLGVVIGWAMGTSRRLRRVLDPLVAALHPIPRLAFFPLLIVAFGIGEYSKLAAVAFGAFFPMLLNTVTGIRTLNPVHLELARSFGATRLQLLTRVILPGSMPFMLTGLRLSSNAAFHSTIGVEMVGSRTGIGSMLWLSWQTFRIDHLYAILVVIATVGISLAALIRWVARRSVPWVAEQSTPA